MAEHDRPLRRGVDDIEPGGWGIVSDLDLMAAMRPELAHATADELAATDPLIVEPTDTLEHAAQLMAEHQTTHAVVVDRRTGEPVGILSTLDVARFAARLRPTRDERVIARPASAAITTWQSRARREQRLEPARAAGQDDHGARRLADRACGSRRRAGRRPAGRSRASRRP